MKDESFAKAKRAFGLFGFLLVVWGFYRLVFRLPEEIEELILKPLVWLGSVAWMLKREKQTWSSAGWRMDGIFKSLYLGLGLGMVFAVEGVVVNIVKYGGLKLVGLELGSTQFLIALVVSVATAISEETVFRGYILSRLSEASKNKWFAVGVSSVMFALIHLPIWVFVLGYTWYEITLQLLVLGIFAVGNGVLAITTGSIVGPVVTHVVWGWAVALFR